MLRERDEMTLEILHFSPSYRQRVKQGEQLGSIA